MMSEGYNDIPSSPGGDSSITIDGLEVSPNVSHAFDLFKQLKHQWRLIFALLSRNPRAFKKHTKKPKKKNVQKTR